MCQGEATPCPQHLRKYVLAVAILGSSLGFIDGTIITVAAQPIREALGASFGAIQWVVNAYTLALSAFLLVGGAAGDRFGKRNVFGAGIIVFAAASVACGLAPTVETLIAARVVQGLGAALMVPGSLALIAVNFPEAERGRAVGIWAAASGITTAIGPLLGGLLIDAGSWRLIFYVNIPLAALTLLLLFGRVPADKVGQGSGPFDLAGAALAFFGVGLVALGFTLAEQAGLSAPTALLSLGAGVAILCAFVFAERAVAAPMLPLDLFRVRDFSVANIQTLLIYFALGGTVFFLPITMMAAHGWSATLAGAIFLPFTATMAVVAPLAGRAADRVGHRTLLLCGPVVVAAACAALAAVAGAGNFAAGVAPVMAVFGIGMGLAIPSLSAVVLAGAGEARSGIASGVNNAVARVAGLLAVAILGLGASAVYAASVGVPGVGFASGTGAESNAATVLAFRAVALVAAALCLCASAFALLLSPKVSAG